jgi:hypothetical protein
MSTMYYTLNKEKTPIGQTHALPKRQGYHFTWTMFPLDFCNFAMEAVYNPCIIDEHEHEYSMNEFIALIHAAESQSFEVGIE